MSMSSLSHFKMKFPPVGVVLVGTDTMADRRGFDGQGQREVGTSTWPPVGRFRWPPVGIFSWPRTANWPFVQVAAVRLPALTRQELLVRAQQRPTSVHARQRRGGAMAS